MYVTRTLHLRQHVWSSLIDFSSRYPTTWPVRDILPLNVFVSVLTMFGICDHKEVSRNSWEDIGRVQARKGKEYCDAWVRFNPCLFLLILLIARSCRSRQFRADCDKNTYVPMRFPNISGDWDCTGVVYLLWDAKHKDTCVDNSAQAQREAVRGPKLSNRSP